MARKKPVQGSQQVSVAQAVRTYIDARPVVRDALAMGIVNLSALTRRIRDETGLGSEEAVLVACRRYKPAPYVVFFVLPVVLIPVFLHSGFDGVFRWTKLYSAVAGAALASLRT